MTDGCDGNTARASQHMNIDIDIDIYINDRALDTDENQPLPKTERISNAHIPRRSIIQTLLTILALRVNTQNKHMTQAGVDV